jgi:hypothetical protein
MKLWDWIVNWLLTAVNQQLIVLAVLVGRRRGLRVGMFDVVIIKCPHCEHENEPQFKPGNMDVYRFPEQLDELPFHLLAHVKDGMFHCENCHIEYFTSVDVSISNPKVSK